MDTDTLDDVTRWRARAQELRALADQFDIPSVQERLRQAAASYDVLADEMEERLSKTLPSPSTETC